MKKIALIADVKDWAFDNAAHIIKNKLSDEFQIDIFYSDSEEFKKDLFTILESLKEYDLIHFFWREILLNFESEEFRKRVIEKYGECEKYIKTAVNKISTGVYDHMFEDDIENIKLFTKYCKAYVVSSKKLFDKYSSYEDIKKPAGIVGDSFEKEVFYPLNLERFDFSEDDKLVIGWAGNSTWNKKQKDENGNPIDFKGFNTILKPVVDDLISKGYNIELKLADRSVKQIPIDNMCEYYSNIHIYICVSSREGTPKPLIESMGCGVPIITTDVGVAREALGTKEQEFILGERNIGVNDEIIRNRLKEKIIYLYNNRNVLKELSQENIEMSQYYEIGNMGAKYREYYKKIIN